MEAQQRFKHEIDVRSSSHDWDCAIAGCVMKSVKRRTRMRASACALVLSVAFTSGVAAAGGIEPAADAVAEFLLPEALHPMRSIHEPMMTPEMDALLQVALRE